MPDVLENALNETCALLMRLGDEAARPDEASASFQLLQTRYPALDMGLVWEEETYSHAVHYDALLRLPGQGTVSLSFSPERAVPWPLRRAHYSRENQIVSVNGKVIEVECAMACLDFLWEKPGLIASLVNLSLIEAAMEQRAIEISAAEMQQAVNAFRQAQRLFTAEATHRWMDENGITHERLEQLAAAPLRTDKLRDQIAADRVEAYFDQHQADFDTAHLARFKVTEAEQAQHICEQVRAGAVDFFAAAQHSFLAEVEADRDELFAVVRRKQLSPQQAAMVFAASAGAVVGPVPSGDGYEIVRVLQINPARLDAPTHKAIRELLFDEWLTQQRQAATIEWFWGDSRTMGKEQASNAS